ncbi:MAG: organoarsenical effux MFS transporter ArsJ [Hyphomicrobiales bacterium]|nr:organoarsenical effux MFS transporter ArsJ [Hyphomicrobiales bacterium]
MASHSSDLRGYAAVTAAYWAFTLTDGALRMLVLLHFHELGFSPVDIAFLFLLYEFMGIVTNLVGGWIAARLGLKVTLYAGLAVQIVALALLSLARPEWALAVSVAYVMGCQALSGVAKDLTKMSSKSAVKLVVREGGEGLLFKWVALLTGSKNALKGLGFFLGGVLLGGLGFQWALWAMAAMLALVLVAALGTLKGDLGRTKQKPGARQLFSKSREINVLSAARLFLFGARDVWFVVGVPVFLSAVLGWSFAQVGGFMAAWVIGYGIVQAAAPRFLRNAGSAASGALAARVWGFVLAALPALIALGLQAGLDARWLVLGGLGLFGVVFAMNSAVHSFLILAYSDHDKVALNVGFYYMANAAGRLLGTLLSGLVYQAAGLAACLWVSALMVAIAAAGTLFLPTRAAAARTA